MPDKATETNELIFWRRKQRKRKRKSKMSEEKKKTLQQHGDSLYRRKSLESSPISVGIAVLYIRKFAIELIIKNNQKFKKRWTMVSINKIQISLKYGCVLSSTVSAIPTKEQSLRGWSHLMRNWFSFHLYFCVRKKTKTETENVRIEVTSTFSIWTIRTF